MKLFSNFKAIYIRLNKNIINKQPIGNIEISSNSIIYIIKIKKIYYNIHINHLFIILHILYRFKLMPKYVLLKKKILFILRNY